MDVPYLIERAGGRPQLMQLLGVKRTTVLDWERANRIPAGRAAQISEKLGVPIEDVIKLATGPRKTGEG